MTGDADNSSSDWLDFRSRRGRVVEYLGALSILFSATVLALVVGKHWSWGPFLLALAVALALLLPYAAVLRIAVRVLKPPPDQLDKARAELPKRLLPSYPVIALWTGIVGASFRVYWPVAVYAALTFAILVLLPLALLPRAKRRAALGHSPRRRPDA
jgi:MFS family permease